MRVFTYDAARQGEAQHTFNLISVWLCCISGVAARVMLARPCFMRVLPEDTGKLLK